MQNVIKKLFSDLSLGSEKKYKNLTIFPIISNKPAPSDFMTIDEMLRGDDPVKIMEVSEEGDVPTLKMINESDNIIFMLDGEELVGSKQNRVTSTFILAPANDEIIIPVSCVERNRWNYKTKSFESGQNRAYFRLRRQMFVSAINNRNRKLKLHPQHYVWKDIDSKLNNMCVKSSTSSMSDIYKKYLKELKRFRAILKHEEGEVGVIALINNKVVSCEVFADSGMMESFYDKIINSYAIDAIEESRGADRTIKSIRKRALSFLKMITALEFEKSDSPVGLGEDILLDSDSIHGSALKHDGRIVYMSLFSKAIQ